MNSISEVLSNRTAGEIRAALVRDYGRDLQRVMAKFGLTADASLLVEQKREDAKAILLNLLWRDQAYSHECMPRERAELLAEKIISENESEGGKYFSNKNSADDDTWAPLTDSTFDSGIIITSPNGLNFCIWFEDED